MSNFKKDYKRTISALGTLATQFKAGWRPELNASSEDQLVAFINDQIPSNSHAYDLLSEILAIEQEKKSFQNIEVERKAIAEREKANYHYREILLNQPLGQILDLRFAQNPLVKTYESYWNWSQAGISENPQQFQELLASEKSDYFFVLQQTGSFDERSESNILELPLTEYQYFILGQFEEPIKLRNAAQRFIDQFDVAKKEEANQLEEMTYTLLRELVFRTFILKF